MTDPTTTDRAPFPSRPISGRGAALAGAMLTAALLASGVGCADRQGEAVPFGTKDRWADRGDAAVGTLATPELDADNVASLRSASLDILRRAARAQNPMLRANALESLSGTGEELYDAARFGLGDQNRGVRFVAAMMVGRERIRPLVPLVEPLLRDPSGSVRAAAIFAMAANGEAVDRSPLADLLMGADLEVRANAAMVLGALGDRSAVPMLQAAYGLPRGTATSNALRAVELQIAEAIFRLNASPSELELIRASLYAGDGEEELVALGAQICGAINDQASLRALAYIATREHPPAPAEVRMAAAAAVMRMDPRVMNSRRAADDPVDVFLAFVGSDSAALRAQAAHGLGWSVDPRVLPTLASLLEDRNAMVQVAAAGAILRATRPTV